jgi:alpha-methylacyl-CoA racemase
MNTSSKSTGPLAGLRVIEVAGIGPAPFCAMLLADLGADVVRIERASGQTDGLQVERRFDVMNRGRRGVALDLKDPADVAQALELIDAADVLIEGFRPGTMERLGLGPDVCLVRNPRLVYGRMTGWGQTGPLAHAAGHDINYIALSGVLHANGRAGAPPVAPLNLAGDLGGGGLLLAYGLLAAVLERVASGRGQVVDASMVEGSALLMTLFYGLHAAGDWRDAHGTNLLDSAAHFYDVYETADAKFVSVGAVEARFYVELMSALGLSADDARQRFERSTWAQRKAEVAAAFRTRTRAEWCAALEGTDACFAPVLGLAEAPHHPHNVARGTFVDIGGIVQPAPAPRFSRTPPAIPAEPCASSSSVSSILAAWRTPCEG